MRQAHAYNLCLVPRRLSLDGNVRAKEGGSPVARNYLAKNEAPEEDATTILRQTNFLNFTGIGVNSTLLATARQQ